MVKNERIDAYLEFVKEYLQQDGINVIVDLAYNFKEGQNHYYQVRFMFINPDKAYRNVTQSIFGDNELGILYDISRAIDRIRNNF